MKTIVSMKAMTTSTWRATFALAAAGVLAACAQTLATNDVTPEPVTATPSAAAAPAAPDPAPPPEQRAPRRATAAARAASPAPVEAPAPTALTREEINGECWMQVEGNRAVRDIDARLKLVQKCVADKTKAQQGRGAPPQ